MGSLKLHGTIESIDELAKFIHEIGKKVGLSPKSLHAMLLASDELVTNIIKYAYKEPGQERLIEIEATEDNGFLNLTLMDSGSRYDPTQAATPNFLETSLEERSVGGLGIFLAMQHLDRFVYERRDPLNICTLAVRINPDEIPSTL